MNDDNGFVLTYQLKGSPNTLYETVYAKSESIARATIQAKYGASLMGGPWQYQTLPSKRQVEEDRKRVEERDYQQRKQTEEENYKERKRQQQKDEDAKQYKLDREEKQRVKNEEEKVRLVHLNSILKDNAQIYEKQKLILLGLLDEWELEKKGLEEEINNFIEGYREKINLLYASYSKEIKTPIDNLNKEIDKHNKENGIEKTNKVKSIYIKDKNFNTVVDITRGIGKKSMFFIFNILFLSALLGYTFFDNIAAFASLNF